MRQIALTLVVLSAALSACGVERPTGMGGGKPPPGFPVDDDTDLLAPIEAPIAETDLCADVACGQDTECRAVVDDHGALVPACLPVACGELPPDDTVCPQACETGYALVDGASTCGCCSIADEPSFRGCYDDKDCSAGERCDHAFCDSACLPGLACAAVCAGRCNAAGLVPTH